MKDPKPQINLFDKGEAWEDAWQGMPEFVQEDLKPLKSINVHFETRADMDAFAKLIEQRITLDTQAVWYPEAERNDFSRMRYIDKDSSEKK